MIAELDRRTLPANSAGLCYYEAPFILGVPVPKCFVFSFSLVFLCSGAVTAQSLSSRVLVVYNDENADSISVAQHYRTSRGIPSANLCAITPATNSTLTLAQFDTSVRKPVQACLDAVDGQPILYIVFSYQTPYKISTPRSFSLDSAVADIWDENATAFVEEGRGPARGHAYYAPAQSQGNVYVPFQAFSVHRDQPTAKRIYSVWRLDAATAALAKGLVDKAIQAETDGLSGIGCFDRYGGDITNSLDSGYASGDWDIRKAADFAREAGFATIEDQAQAEFGTAPAPPRCDGAALYAGWYSYNNYPDVFTWNSGAIGFHLDSGSALDPRGGTNWTAMSVQRGITITSGAVAEPYLTGLVHPDGFFRNVFEGANVGDAMLRNTAWLKWMNVNTGDPLYRPFPAGRSPFDLPRNEDALMILPTAPTRKNILNAATPHG